MIQILIDGNQLYSSLSLLARQSALMLTELPGMVTVYIVLYMPLGTAFETLLALNYNSFILTVGIIIGVAIYSIEGGGYKVFDSNAGDMNGDSHSEGTCVLLEISSMHKLV